MSKLSSHGRPYVEFDPTNEEHRRYFAQFVQHSAWKDCPYRFYVTGVSFPIPAMQRMLLDYYATEEFGKVYA
jgi:hypothetical protein